MKRLSGIVGIGVILLFVAACGVTQVNQEEEERPSGREVASQAGDAVDRADEGLVLYSTSIEQADTVEGDETGVPDTLEEPPADEPAEDDPSERD